MRAYVLFCLSAILVSGAVTGGEYRAFWADAFHTGFRTPAEIDRMFDDMVAAKANAVFIEARHRGAVYYLRSNEPATEDAVYQKGFDALEYAIQKGRERGIEVHLWSPVTPLWDAARPPADPKHIWHAHGPNTTGADLWMTVTASGKVSRSLDLGHPGAAKYTADVFIDALRNYDLDGIHLDYIRYPEDDRYGWNPTAVARFNRLYARDGMPADSDPAWAAFRRKQVTDFVRQVYLRAYELKQAAKVTASVITWGTGPLNDAEFRTKDAYSRVFQDWPSWLEEGIIDVAMPMNYFVDARNGVMLDRWLEYEKDRQFGRAVMPGLGIYLNPIEDSLAQVTRVLAPSAAGNLPAGVALYSYASTNTLNAAGAPVVANAQFYRLIAELFKDPSPPPRLPWRDNPQRGNVLGTLTVDGGPSWLNDGVDVVIESDTRPGVAVRTLTDSTGFFGAVELEPDYYFIRLARAGRELFRTAPLEVGRGMAVRFDIFLREADFAAIAPRVSGADVASGAPGELVTLQVANVDGDYAAASSVPLPRSLSGVQVFVNGQAAALSFTGAGRVQFQLPLGQPQAEWQIVVRRGGLDSAPFRLAYTPARPRIEVVRRTEWGVEIYATGLGATRPVPPAGFGGASASPYNVLMSPVAAVVRTPSGEVPLGVTWAGLAPYQPYRYQVNAGTAAGPVPGGSLVILVDGVESPPFPLPALH